MIPWKVGYLDLKDLLNYKTALLLLSIAAANLIVFVLLWRLDGFVHVDLYNYGLVFNSLWANEYWHLNGLLWTFLAGATALAVVSIVMHYFHSKKPSQLSKWACFFLPVGAMVYQVAAIMYLNQINGVVWNTLYDYGVQYNIDWSATYNPVSMPALTLMTVALLALAIPAIKALDIIKIEIVQEDNDGFVASEESEEAFEHQKTVQPSESLCVESAAPEKEEPEPKILTVSAVLEKEYVETKNLKTPPSTALEGLQETKHAFLQSTALESSGAMSAALEIGEIELSTLAVTQTTEPVDGLDEPIVEEEKVDRVKTEVLTATAKKTAKKRRKRSRRKRKRSRNKAQVSSGKSAKKENKPVMARAQTSGMQKKTLKTSQSSSIMQTVVSSERKKKIREIAESKTPTVQKTGKKRKKQSLRKRRKTRAKPHSPQT